MFSQGAKSAKAAKDAKEEEDAADADAKIAEAKESATGARGKPATGAKVSASFCELTALIGQCRAPRTSRGPKTQTTTSHTAPHQRANTVAD